MEQWWTLFCYNCWKSWTSNYLYRSLFHWWIIIWKYSWIDKWRTLFWVLSWKYSSNYLYWSSCYWDHWNHHWKICWFNNNWSWTNQRRRKWTSRNYLHWITSCWSFSQWRIFLWRSWNSWSLSYWNCRTTHLWRICPWSFS